MRDAVLRRRLSAVLIAALVLTVVATTVRAFNGGATKGAAVALPITPPSGSFTGDNTGLTTAPVTNAQRWNNVTWWTFTPTVNMTIGVRATSIAPARWDNTLEVWSGSPAVTLVTQNDDFYGLDAQVTFTAVAGVPYVIGLGGFSSGSTGTATIRLIEAPSPPVSVTATASNGAALVTWAMPSANDESVTSYLVTRYINGVQNGTASSVTGFPPALSRNMTGLVNGTAYTFRVQAVNAVAAGTLSAPSAAVTPVGPPGAPTAVSGVGGDAQVSVSFSAPASDGGAAITSYTITSTPGSFSATGAGSPLVVTGLANGTAYTFRVNATNSQGAGAQSAASAPVTPTATIASQTIVFGALAAKTTGDAAFVITASGGGSGNAVTFTSSTSAICTVSSATVTIVAAGTCSIAANQAGNAQYSAAPTVTQSFTVAPPACALSLVGGPMPMAQVALPYGFTLATGGTTGGATVTLTDGTLPAGLALASDGMVTGIPTASVSARITVHVSDGACSANRTYTLNVGAARWITTGADAGATAHVRSFDSRPAQIDGPVGSFLAEAAGFTGGVRVALADVNGDGVVDVITGAGPGGPPTVRIVSGANGGLVRAFEAFDASFTGGVFVASGDVNQDGVADIIVGAGEGQAPLVRVFDGPTGARLTWPIGEFLAYSAGFAGGVRVAAGDVNGDGFADVITGAGPGGSPHVRVWSGGARGALTELAGFHAYTPGFAGGVYVAAGDVNGDGVADVITGAGAGGGPHVRAWDVRTGTELAGFFAYDPAFAGGVRVAATDFDGDGYAEIVTAAGPGGGPHVRVWATGTGTTVTERAGWFAYSPDWAGGVFIAAPAPLRRMAIDGATPSTSVPGSVAIVGWAIDEAAVANSVGVTAIHVWAYDAISGVPTFAGATTPGDERPDVARAFGGQFHGSGFHVDTTPLQPGAYDMVVYALGPSGVVAQRSVRVIIQ